MRGTITKRGKNSWQVKFDLSRQEGKRRQRYSTVKGTYKDAQKKLTELLGAADAGTLPDPSVATVAGYVRDWLDSAHEQSPKTLERYRELAERQIIPHLGSDRLQRLKPEQITKWHSALLAEGLWARTVGHAHRVLRLVLQCAVKNVRLHATWPVYTSPPNQKTKRLRYYQPITSLPSWTRSRAACCILSFFWLWPRA